MHLLQHFCSLGVKGVWNTATDVGKEMMSCCVNRAVEAVKSLCTYDEGKLCVYLYII